VRRKAARVSDLIEEVLASQGMRSVAWMARLRSSWPEIVGPLLSGKTSAAKLRSRVLTVLVLNHAWAQELQMRKQELLDRICRAIGDDAVCNIRFQVGPIPEALPEQAEATAADDDAIPAADPEGMSLISDPETRRILRSVARKAACRKR
jgi:predicted nucleic acid-binding Zn ribbon protein